MRFGWVESFGKRIKIKMEDGLLVLHKLTLGLDSIKFGDAQVGKVGIWLVSGNEHCCSPVNWVMAMQCYLVAGPVMLGLVRGFPQWEVDGKTSWWGQVVSWVSQVGRLRRAPSRSDWPGLPSPHWPSGARRQQVTRGHCARCAIALSNDEPGSSRCTIPLTRLDLRLLC